MADTITDSTTQTDTTKKVGGMTDGDLETLISKVTEKAMTEATRIADEKFEKLKMDIARKSAPDSMVSTASTLQPQNVTIKYNDDGQKSKIGTIMHAMGCASLNKFSLEDGFKTIGKEMSMFINEKSMTASSAGDGGFLINEQFSTEIIPLLYNATVVRKAGCPVLNLPNGNMTFPIGSTGATGFYRGETEKKRTSGLTFSQGNMSVKEAVIQVPVSDKLLRYASFNLPQYIQNDMTMRLSLLEDYSYLMGIGTNFTPKGISNWLLPNCKFTMTASPDATKIRTDLLKLPKAMAKANLPKVQPAWFMDSTVYYHLISQVDPVTYQPLDYARTLASESPTLFGAPVYVTNSLSGSGYVFYVDLAYCLIGMGMDVRMKFTEGGQYLASDNLTVVSGQVTGESVFEVALDHDFFVKQPLALTALTGVTWGS